MVPLHLGIQSTADQAVLQHLLLKKECISGPIQFKAVLFRSTVLISIPSSDVYQIAES